MLQLLGKKLSLIQRLKSWDIGLECVYTSDHSFFNSKLQNFTVVPKRPKFYCCTQATICFSQRNTKFRIVSKRLFVYWLRNTKLLKLLRNSHLLFDNKLKNPNLYPNCHWFFDAKYRSCTHKAIQFLTSNNENRTYLFYQWTFNNSKKLNKAIS